MVAALASASAPVAAMAAALSGTRSTTRVVPATPATPAALATPVVPASPVNPAGHSMGTDTGFSVVAAGSIDPVAGELPDVAPVSAAAPGPCTCLTKTYTQAGLVVFADMCTKETASAAVGGTSSDATPVPPADRSSDAAPLARAADATPPARVSTRRPWHRLRRPTKRRPRRTTRASPIRISWRPIARRQLRRSRRTKRRRHLACVRK